MAKYKRFRIRIKPDKFFEFNDNCTRGHLFKIVKPRCEKTLRLNSFPVHCINKWNTLSEDIVYNVTVFNSKLDLIRCYCQKDTFWQRFTEKTLLIPGK